jgi:HEAT repeat protein
MIPYEQITETADRRWTFRLLERLACPDLSSAERNALSEALCSLSDPRAVGPLEEILVDRGRSDPVRQAISSVLRGMHFLDLDVPVEKLSCWWRKGDAVLRRHALLCMNGFRCPDILLRVASDPAHELQALALLRMEFWFDRPEQEAVKISALSHPDAKVRTNAAYILLWDEPVAAEQPLIEATGDIATEVVVEAANTLKYYPSRRTIRCLHRLRAHDAEKIRRQAAESLAEMRSDIRARLCSTNRRVAGQVRAWLRPVWDLLAFADKELLPGDTVTRPSAPEARKAPLTLTELLELLGDPDRSPLVLQQQLGDNTWESYGPAERSRLRRVLLAHTDLVVREQAARCFAAWEDVAGLMVLAEDSCFPVRKTAIYHLGTVPSTPGIAELAWDHLQRADSLGVHATETLTTFARQAPPAVAVPRLAAIADDPDQRESLRVTALEELTRVQASEQIGRLLPRLREPPAVTWGLHIALLEAVERLRLANPEIDHLREVDNLHVQEAIAKVDM